MAKIRFGDDGLSRKLEVWADGIEREVIKGVAKTAQRIQSQASELAPVDEGNLKGSIDLSFKSPFHATVSVGASYAPYVEFGTGVYATQGSRAKHIPWTYYSPGYGWVTTSGIRAQPFWTPSLLLGEQYFNSYFGG